MIIISTLVFCILIGWLAQSWKGRTGVAWFLISLIFTYAIGVFTFYAAETTNPGLLDTTSGKIGSMITAYLTSGVIMLIVIATLPNKKKTTESKE